MKFRFTSTALFEIDEIIVYIGKHHPAAARTVAGRIETTIAALADFPEMGQVTDEGRIRRMPIGPYPYLVFYTVESEEIVILHVRHGARRYPWDASE
jgi:toxin ParE1/3/4